MTSSANRLDAAQIWTGSPRIPNS